MRNTKTKTESPQIVEASSDGSMIWTRNKDGKRLDLELRLPKKTHALLEECMKLAKKQLGGRPSRTRCFMHIVNTFNTAMESGKITDTDFAKYREKKASKAA